MAAMRGWRERQSHGMANFFNGWLVDRRQTHAQLRAVIRKREVMGGRRCLMAWAELAWTVMPTRVNQRQTAYFMAVKQERRLLQQHVGAWLNAVQSLKGRKAVAEVNKQRYSRVRDRVELEAEQQGWREELIESVVKEEMQEEAVRIMTGRRGQLQLQTWLREWKKFHKRNQKKGEGEEKVMRLQMPNESTHQ